MVIQHEKLIKRLKESSTKSFLESIKTSKKYKEQFFKDVEEIATKEIKKVKRKKFASLENIQNQTDKMIDEISNKFYHSCKKELYMNISVLIFDNDIVEEKELLDNLFDFIELTYHKPYYRLLFLKNNLGFIGEDNFFTKQEISISSETKVFIEIRAEIVQKIVNCFTYWESW